MEPHCPGSDHVTVDPPPNAAATCPVCGRAVPVEARHSADGLQFAVARHRAVGPAR